MIMWDLFFILGMVLLVTSLWKLRQQSELAKSMIEQHCKKLNLQVLSFSRSHFNFKLGADFLQASFIFEFSSDGAERYQGRITMLGHKVREVEMDAYRIPII